MGILRDFCYTVDLSNVKAVTDRQRRHTLFITASTADELSGGTNVDNVEQPPNRKITGFSEFFAILRYDAHLKSEFSPKILKIDEDNLRAKAK